MRDTLRIAGCGSPPAGRWAPGSTRHLPGLAPGSSPSQPPHQHRPNEGRARPPSSRRPKIKVLPITCANEQSAPERSYDNQIEWLIIFHTTL
jgi:hypothetical protein